MHAEGVVKGGQYQWATFAEPEAEHWQRFEAAMGDDLSEDDVWAILEPT